MSESLLIELAEGFWRAAGGRAESEADLVAATVLALPLAVIVLPVVSIVRMEDWFESHDAVVSLNRSDRRLRGGLVARRGHGVVFVDGADVEHERRFTLAHEVAHFLVDYRHPRERALRLLGDGIADVLDGHRSATASERTDAVLAACPLGVYVDLLERGGELGVAASVHETRANRLAWELLAPAAELVETGFGGANADLLARRLREHYRLPATEAAAYAQSLLREWGRPPSFLDWLSS